MKKKALFLYSSTDGQTVKILNFIAQEISADYQCDILDLHNTLELDSTAAIDFAEYDRVLIGASVRYGRLNKKLYQFIENHHSALDEAKSAFFCVNLTARKKGKDTPEGSAYTRKFLETSKWKPCLIGVFAGALFYPRYRFFDRVMIQFIMRITGGETDTSKEVEYTDWGKVAQFSHQFVQI